MKKVLALLLSLALVFSLCACGGAKEQPKEEPKDEPAAPTEEAPTEEAPAGEADPMAELIAQAHASLQRLYTARDNLAFLLKNAKAQPLTEARQRQQDGGEDADGFVAWQQANQYGRNPHGEQ